MRKGRPETAMWNTRSRRCNGEEPIISKPNPTKKYEIQNPETPNAPVFLRRAITRYRNPDIVL